LKEINPPKNWIFASSPDVLASIGNKHINEVNIPLLMRKIIGGMTTNKEAIVLSCKQPKNVSSLIE
jgi:hypothetical protein